MVIDEFDRIKEAAAKFETLSVKLSIAADLSDLETSDFRQKIMAMSQKMKLDTEEMFKVAINASKAGIATEHLMGFVEGISKVAVAMDDIPADEIVDSITKINSAFRLLEPEKLGSAIDWLADSGTAKAKDLFNAGSRLAGIAKAARFSVSQMLAVVTTTLETGANPEQAAGTLGRLFTAMQLDPRRNKEGIDEVKHRLGFVSSDALRQEMAENPLAILKEYLDSLNGKSLNEVSTSLKRLGIIGSEDAGVIMNLAGQTDRLGKYAEGAANQLKTGAQAEQSFAKYAGTAKAQSVELNNALEEMHATIGVQMAPAFAGINRLLMNMIGQTNDAAQGWTKLREAASLFGEFIGGTSESGATTRLDDMLKWSWLYLRDIMALEAVASAKEAMGMDASYERGAANAAREKHHRLIAPQDPKQAELDDKIRRMHKEAVEREAAAREAAAKASDPKKIAEDKAAADAKAARRVKPEFGPLDPTLMFHSQMMNTYVEAAAKVKFEKAWEIPKMKNIEVQGLDSRFRDTITSLIDGDKDNPLEEIQREAKNILMKIEKNTSGSSIAKLSK